MNLTNEELKRYKRQIILPEVGIEGQEKLKSAKILIIGMGGLGCPVALYLASAGIGTLGLIDNDNVDITNLQRQVIYTEQDLGKNKAEQAKKKLEAMNKEINIKAYPEAITEKNYLEITKDYEILVDCTDNFKARYLLNEASIKQQKPYVYGSVSQFEGQASVFSPKEGPCYSCIFPAMEDDMVGTCAETGVLGVLSGMIGLIQATETIKLILGKETLKGKILIYDALKMQFREFKIQKNHNCKACIKHIKQNPLSETMSEEISPQELKPLLDSGKVILIDVREQGEYEFCNIKGAKLIPMGELQERMNEIPKDKDVVLHCHTGRRSMHVLKHLKQLGWTRIQNLKGGIDAWAEDIEPEMPRY